MGIFGRTSTEDVSGPGTAVRAFHTPSPPNPATTQEAGAPQAESVPRARSHHDLLQQRGASFSCRGGQAWLSGPGSEGPTLHELPCAPKGTNKVGKDGPKRTLASLFPAFKAACWRPHLAVQAHLHRAYLPCVLIDAEELGAALLQDGVPQGRVVRLRVVSICGLGSGHIGAWEG